MTIKKKFEVVEASIKDLHKAIKSGEITLVEVVQKYIDRVQQYNGVSSMLVTEDGADITQVSGLMRGGTPLNFPLKTIKVDDVLPDRKKYKGPPLEFGRMEQTASKNDVYQQFGMIAGIPNAGQVNALATINIRGERSVTCWGEYDKHPSDGPLPEGAPAICEIFRQQPDAIERAAELDSEFGRNPDLESMPMYGVTFSFKDPFDTKDMRSTGGADAAYDIDFPARDHKLVEQLRNKGAIIFAKAVNTEYNGRAGDPGGKNIPDKILPSTLGYQRSTWAGNPSNPYDTTRSASLGSSSGSAVSVSTNLTMASLGEETRASCRGPSNHNAICLILPHKAMIGFDGGAIGADIYCDRTGVHGKTLDDCAKILDALKHPEDGYYDHRDPYTTVPRSSIIQSSFESNLIGSKQKIDLSGKRLGLIVESLVYPNNSMAEVPIVDAAKNEIKDILGKKLNSIILQSGDPLWRRDPEFGDMTCDFRRALTKLLPIFMPDILFRLDNSGKPVFLEFADAIKPTEFFPGKIFGRGSLDPIDYMVGLAEGSIQPPSNLTIASIQEQKLANSFKFHISQYLLRRADDWRAAGFHEAINNWEALNARSKFWGDDQRAAFKNWEETTDPRNALDGRQGINERIMLRELLRRIDMMVLIENKLDAFVRLHTPWAPGLIGQPHQYDTMHNLRAESLYGPNAGLSEILVPAGYIMSTYDPIFKLNNDATKYISKASDKETKLNAPGLPFSLVFRSEPGTEDTLLNIASCYEKASKRRISPPHFGPL
ncbi:amidase family protein [Alphaproteobacteria bacterium]|nr:amidase family protein [Alphaproteobacteria bacterium]